MLSRNRKMNAVWTAFECYGQHSNGTIECYMDSIRMLWIAFEWYDRMLHGQHSNAMVECYGQHLNAMVECHGQWYRWISLIHAILTKRIQITSETQYHNEVIAVIVKSQWIHCGFLTGFEQSRTKF